MSRIEQLIAELCPDGVEHLFIGDICEVLTGGDTPNNYIKGLTKPSDEFPYPIYSNGIEIYGYSDSYRVGKDAVSISSIGNVGHVAFRKAFFTPIIRLKVLIPKLETLNTRYLYYALLNVNFVGTNSSLSSMKADDVKKYIIPIPPLPIQQEIVRILDTFTDLDAELQAELEARKKQFNFYKEKQFNYCKDSVEWRPLGEVGKFQRGKRFVKNDIVSSGIPCIHYGELYTHYKTWTKKTKSYIEAGKAEKLRFAKPGDVIIVTAGETIEDIGNCVAWLGDTDVVIHDACFAYSHYFIPKFVSYYFQTDLFRSQIRRFISSGKISAIHASGLSKATIPIPPLAEQERIVSILDKFEALVNEELPAEIAARRKQYEYYREKLLAFEPLIS